jgi:hypothetical protein
MFATLNVPMWDTKRAQLMAKARTVRLGVWAPTSYRLDTLAGFILTKQIRPVEPQACEARSHHFDQEFAI